MGERAHGGVYQDHNVHTDGIGPALSLVQIVLLLVPLASLVFGGLALAVHSPKAGQLRRRHLVQRVAIDLVRKSGSGL